MSTARPGWYPDPSPAGGWRYWDGQAWTDQSAATPPSGWGQPPPPQGRGGRVASVVRMVVIIIAGLAAAQVATVAFGAFTYLLPLGDAEETDWSTQPLEIVADAEESACVLNVSAVAPGRHEVAVLAVGAPAQVLIEDPAGTVLLRASADPDGIAEPRSVHLEEVGTHRVECRHDDGVTTTARLRVAPADEVARQ